MISVATTERRDRRPPFANLPPFDEMSPARLTEIEDEVGLLTLPGGQILMREGEPGDALYFVMSGLLAVVIERSDGGTQIVAEIRTVRIGRRDVDPYRRTLLRYGCRPPAHGTPGGAARAFRAAGGA